MNNIFYDIDSNSIEDEDSSYAKIKNGRYYILFKNSRPVNINPEVINIGPKNRSQKEFRSVNKKAFESYLLFLKTKRRNYLKQVERELL